MGLCTLRKRTTYGEVSKPGDRELNFHQFEISQIEPWPLSQNHDAEFSQ